MLQRKLTQYLSNSPETDTSYLRRILVITFLISVALSLSQIYADSIVNDDGILYLKTASFLQKGDWGAAAKLYNWLFYPFLIAQLSTLTSLALENAAYILNTLFSAFTCSVFVLIIHELGGNKKTTLWLAAILILCFPNLNEYRNLIIRGHGYWAFYLISCYLFLRAYQDTNFKLISSFVVAAIFTSLFRAEGIVLLTLTPLLFYLLITNKHPEYKKYFIPLLFCFLIIMSFSIWTFDGSFLGFTKLSSQITNLQNQLSSIFSQDSATIRYASEFLHKISKSDYSEDYSVAVILLTFFTILITEIVSTTSPLYAIGLGVSLYKKVSFTKHQLKQPWLVLIALNLLVLSTFLATRFFLAGRYPMSLAFLLLLPIPFLVSNFLNLHFSNTPEKKLRWPIKLIIIIFLLISIDGLVSFGEKKDYLKEAGVWIANNNQMSNKRIYTNNNIVAYYSNHHTKKRISTLSVNQLLKKLGSMKLNQYEFLAISFSRKEVNRIPQIIMLLNKQPVKAFSNNRNAQVLIFKS